MKTLFRKLRWALYRNNIEHGLMQFCKLEYSAADAPHAFIKVLAAHKAAFINGGSTNV